jgi:4-amino-4-deoxy-L-arabinose transferase-like glycosyltransferase
MRIVFGPVLLFLTVLLFYATLRLSFSSRTALLGAGTLGLYWPLYALLPSLHSEVPAIFFVVALMYGLTRYLREGGLPYFVISAGAASMLALSRVVFGGILLAGFLVWAVAAVIRRDARLRRVALVHGVALVLCIPWLSYTYSITGHVFYWGSSGGMSLYWMASPEPGDLGDWHSADEVARNQNLAAHRPFFDSLRGLDQIEADERLRSKALELIREDPANYVEHVAANASRMWFSMPFSYTPQTLGTLFYVLPNALLLAALLASLGVLWVRRRSLTFETGPFLVLLALGLGIQVLFAAYVRMLAPLAPVMIWLVVYAVAQCVRLGPPAAEREA